MARSNLKNVMRLLDEVQQDIPVEQSFLADLKRSIEIQANKESRKPSQTYKPSSMNCIRGMYYQVVGVDCDEDSANYCSVGICNSGSDIHQRIQKSVLDMQSNGIDCEYVDVSEFVKSRNLDYLEIREYPNPAEGVFETKLFHKDLNMSFLCDGIIRYKNHYYILEIKTEASFKWVSRTDTDPKHYNQGTAYSIAFNLPEVIFLYVNRDVLDMKAYMFVPTDDMKQSLIGTIEDCDGYVKRGICPPKPEHINKRQCDYCGYKTHCRKE